MYCMHVHGCSPIRHGPLLSAYSRFDNWKSAAALVEALKAAGAAVDERASTGLLGAYARSGMWDDAHRVLDELASAGRPLTIAYNQLIAACGGDWRRAQSIFAGMAASGAEASPTTLNALCNVYTRGGRVDLALEAYRALPAATRNTVTYNAMISLLGKKGRCDEAVALYQELLDCGLQPTTVTFR